MSDSKSAIKLRHNIYADKQESSGIKGHKQIIKTCKNMSRHIRFIRIRIRIWWEPWRPNRTQQQKYGTWTILARTIFYSKGQALSISAFFNSRLSGLKGAKRIMGAKVWSISNILQTKIGSNGVPVEIWQPLENFDHFGDFSCCWFFLTFPFFSIQYFQLATKIQNSQRPNSLFAIC